MVLNRRHLAVWALGAFGAMALTCPTFAQDNLPKPEDIELIDLPNDNGGTLALLFNLSGNADGSKAIIRALGSEDLLAEFELSESEQTRLNDAQGALAAALEPILGQRDQLLVQLAGLRDELTALENVRDKAGAAAKRKELWPVQQELTILGHQIAHHKDNFTRAAGKIDEKAEIYSALSKALGTLQYLPTDAQIDLSNIETKGAQRDIFGHEPLDADKGFVRVQNIVVPNPRADASLLTNGHDQYDSQPSPVVAVPLERGRTYVLSMVVSTPQPPDESSTEAEAPPVIERIYELGSATPEQSLFKSTLSNTFAISVMFGLIILVSIARARRNPNLFIRRINGLEAVDEAIGRATEMGKPVLYLNGMNGLDDLATLAAINILGRVAGKVANYDSSLLVPTRDPVVMTVAQEVVREAYLDAGRPDAFREDNVFFVTDDQFSYTASTCGIMMREKPAANFFMGYYYAESLLLAETGANTGAIQIAGTDSQNQLPFFITTCDYTLIGEELYAASAYLSREPMLLGSLKGQDVAKAVMMLVIIFQTILFAVSAVNPTAPPIDFIKRMVEPL